MIKIENLTKRYGQIKALDNVSFEVKPGEVLGFLGPNGAGKTTTMNIITGFIPPTSGKVTVDGFDIMDDPLKVKKRIGYLPEQPPLYFDLTVYEYLKFVADLKGVEGYKRSKHLNDIIENVKLNDVRTRLVKNLSKGYKQRVGLAQAMIGDPPVIILDEPTVGLDPTQVIEVRKLIAELKKKHTIIFSSHILSEVSAVAGRVVIINKGQIAAVDSTKNLTKDVGANKFIYRIVGPKSSVMSTVKNVYGVTSVSSVTYENDVGEYIVDFSNNGEARKTVFFELSKNGYPIIELKPYGNSLEEIFLNVIAREAKGGR